MVCKKDLYYTDMQVSIMRRNDMIGTLKSTTRYMYLGDLPQFDNMYFEQMVHRIYPAEF